MIIYNQQIKLQPTGRKVDIMLNKIKFSYKVAEKQDRLFTPNHTKFKCKIKVDGLQYTFDYQCNTTYMTPNLKDCMECILDDMMSYDNARDIIDFCNEFGYTDNEGLKIYKACKKDSKALHRLFTDAELDELWLDVEGE